VLIGASIIDQDSTKGKPMEQTRFAKSSAFSLYKETNSGCCVAAAADCSSCRVKRNAAQKVHIVRLRESRAGFPQIHREKVE